MFGWQPKETQENPKSLDSSRKGTPNRTEGLSSGRPCVWRSWWSWKGGCSLGFWNWVIDGHSRVPFQDPVWSLKFDEFWRGGVPRMWFLNIIFQHATDLPGPSIGLSEEWQCYLTSFPAFFMPSSARIRPTARVFLVVRWWSTLRLVWSCESNGLFFWTIAFGQWVLGGSISQTTGNNSTNHRPMRW